MSRYQIPFFMVDLANYQLITTSTIPQGTIRDTKGIVVTETPIPGRNFQPMSSGGNANRKISFTLPIVKRNDAFGNLLMLKQFDGLRNQSQGFNVFRPASSVIMPNPQVLFYWGTGSIPLIWYVTKCDFAHTANMMNIAAYPQHTLVEIELTLDEENLVYKAEEMFRTVISMLGNTNTVTNFSNQRGRDFVGVGSMF